MSIEISPIGQTNQEAIQLSTERDQALRALLGTDYEFAHESGLIDLFYYDPDTGEDGLMHTLIGDGTGGFHSESAVGLLQDNESTSHLVEGTFVEREHLETKNSREKRIYVERPFEFYAGHVAINGVHKTVATRGSDGSEKSGYVKNGMYPKEYDPLAIMRTVSQAYSSRDQSLDVLSLGPDGDMLINRAATMPMLDGVTEQPVSLVLDPVSKKIRSAVPRTKTDGQMKLSPQEVQQHLFG